MNRSRKSFRVCCHSRKNVNHPLAKAIVEKAINEKIGFEYSGDNKSNNNIDINNKFLVKVGKGVSVFYDGHMISAGNFSYIKEQSNLMARI